MSTTAPSLLPLLRSENRVFSADVTSPIHPEPSSLLHRTVGPPVVLRRALDGLDGVHAAYVHGSWARRAAGEPGPEPGDVDVLVVGEVDVEDVRESPPVTVVEPAEDRG